jgi:putative transposase
MLIQKAFKYRLQTTPEIEEKLRRMAGCRRFVWNNGLSEIKAALDSGEKRPRYAQLSAGLLPLKSTYPFLSEDAVAQALQQTLKDLDRAVKDAFDKKSPKAFPAFKRKGKSTDSFRIPQGFWVDQVNSRIKLPKLGWLRYRNSRPIMGKPKNATVSHHAGHWYVSIQTEYEIAEPTHQSATSIIGIDRGVNVLAALSDGTLIQPLNAFERVDRKLARLQRQLARKVKFSENWKKCKARIARLHGKTADMRKDYLHKISTAIAKNHGLVVLEDLRVQNMTASAKGTAEAPGKNVKRKARLNRSILDQGWGELARMMEYKLKWLGGTLLKISPAYTSQTCNVCGHVHPDNRKGVEFVCTSCGHEDHADINAAKNILAAGLAVIACGEYLDVTGSMKQEPTGGNYALAA